MWCAIHLYFHVYVMWLLCSQTTMFLFIKVILKPTSLTDLLHSFHTLDQHQWFRESESTGVCSPVLYVIRVGTYQCHMTTDDGKGICTSLNIEVVSGAHSCFAIHCIMQYLQRGIGMWMMNRTLGNTIRILQCKFFSLFSVIPRPSSSTGSLTHHLM